ncbi:hypothetical protein EG329_006088 [Mollisiaceae sp. DMI_Dod_QoI]|nr:hypothetical protein EG329_006088 [Helotiales sp. DMI_Dod_QoI]
MATTRSIRSPTTCPTFTCFPRLPIEIRTMIWKHTLEPRVVELKFEYGETDIEDIQLSLYTQKGFYTEVRTPAALEVNRDSRQAALPYYELCFGSWWYPARTRFNFKLDILYLDYDISRAFPLLFGSFTDSEMAKLRYLALDTTEWCMVLYDQPGFEQKFPRFIKALQGLEELLFSFKADYWFYDSEMWGGFWDESKIKYDHIQLLESLPEVLSWIDGKDWPSMLNSHFPKLVAEKQRFVLGLRKSLTAVRYDPPLSPLPCYE